MDREKEIFSYSRLKTAQECEYKYYKRYVRKQYPSVKMGFFLTGGMVHDVIDRFLKQECHLSGVLSDFLWDAMHCKFGMHAGTFWSHAKLVEKLLDDTRASTIAINLKATKHWKEKCATLVESSEQVLNSIGKAFFPLIISDKFHTMWKEVEGGLDNFFALNEKRDEFDLLISEKKLQPVSIFGVLMGGKVDRIETGSLGYRVYDYKTGVAQWSLKGLRTNEQLLWYAYALKQEMGALPTHVGIWDLTRGQIVETPINKEDVRNFLLVLKPQIDSTVALHEKQEATPEEELTFKTPHSYGEAWKCKTCEYAYDEGLKCKFYQAVSKVAE